MNYELNQILKVRSQQGSMTEAQWRTSNPVLLKGEVAVASDTNRIKVGDGTSHWSDLPYLDARNAEKATSDGNGLNIDSSYEKKVQAASRGVQLVTNGSGTMGNNYNFSYLTFDGSQANGSGGSFTYPTLSSYVSPSTDNFMMVNPNEYLRLTMDVKSAKGLASFFGVLFMYDVDKQIINANHVAHMPGTITELTQDLNQGDTVVHLKDVSGWGNNYNETHRRGFIFWDYKNSFGYLYPELTYSRHGFENIYDKGAINTATNTITLRKPWANAPVPMGTRLSQSDSGGTYSYWGITGGILKKEWTTYTATYLGTDYSGRLAGGKFRPGTAYVKLGFLWDYNRADDQIWMTNLFAYPMRPATDANNVPWSGVTAKPTTIAGYGISDAKIASGVITLGSNTITPLTQHQDISGKANKATTLAGYGITDAKIASGVITLGSNTIKPLTSHQDISGKADKATTLSGYGITDAKIVSGVITLGGNSITPLTSHQDISGKADKATTLSGYGITDAKIVNGVITLGSNTITPLTSHQSLAEYAKTTEVTTAISNAIGGVTSFEYSVVDTLPDKGKKGTIYLVNHGHGDTDLYDEYIWVGNTYEKIGNTDIDLSGYLQKSDISAWAKASTKPSYAFSEITSKPTTLSGYGITDAKIASGVITLGGNTITPLTSHQDISGKADKATTLAGYGITDAKISLGVITLGSNTITPLTSHQDISGKADKATTLAGYGITDAKISSGVITLGSNTITPLTSHQSLSGVAKLADTNTFSGEQNIFSKVHRDSYYASNVCRHFYGGTPSQFIIWSKIKYASGTHMPVVRIYGYAYGLNCPIEIKVGFYIYGGDLGWCGSISQGAWNPTVYLFKYTENNVDYVAIGLDGSCYFCGFQVDVQVGASGSFNSILVEGWKTSHNGASNTIPIIPAVGTDKCIQVPKKPIATDISGNASYATTAGSATNASKVPWSGVSSKPTTLSGYGITDAKIASGVITLGSNTITPLTQHQDISGKADKSTTLAGYGITDAKIDAGVITLGGSTIKPLTKHQDISGKVDKVAGMGLSSNDYTTDEKNKLAGIATGATANAGTVTSVSAGNGLSGGTITSSGTISLKVASAGGLGGIVPMVDYTSDLPFEATNGDAIGSEVIADMAEKNTIALPIQVDAEGHAFVVIGEQVIEKLRALLGV